MPITDGGTTLPVDSAGIKQYGLYDLTNLFLPRRAAAAVLSLLRAESAMLVAPPGEWSVQAAPAANVLASAARAAGGAGVRHVLRSLSASAGAVGAPAATVLNVVVRDGASGAGAILWQRMVPVTAVAGAVGAFDVVGLNIVGSANTAMTVEFAAAGGAGVFETVAATGYDAA